MSRAAIGKESERKRKMCRLVMVQCGVRLWRYSGDGTVWSETVMVQWWWYSVEWDCDGTVVMVQWGVRLWWYSGDGTVWSETVTVQWWRYSVEWDCDGTLVMVQCGVRLWRVGNGYVMENQQWTECLGLSSAIITVSLFQFCICMSQFSPMLSYCSNSLNYTAFLQCDALWCLTTTTPLFPPS